MKNVNIIEPKGLSYKIIGILWEIKQIPAHLKNAIHILPGSSLRLLFCIGRLHLRGFTVAPWYDIL